MEDLEDEQVERGHGIEQPLAPGVFLLLACPLDGVGRKFGGEVLLEAAQDGDDTWQHGVRPVNPTFKAAGGYAILFRAPA